MAGGFFCLFRACVRALIVIRFARAKSSTLQPTSAYGLVGFSVAASNKQKKTKNKPTVFDLQLLPFAMVEYVRDASASLNLRNMRAQDRVEGGTCGGGGRSASSSR